MTDLHPPRTKRDKPEAEQALGNGASLLLVAAAVLSTALGLIFLNPLLVALFGASPTALPYARDYLER